MYLRGLGLGQWLGHWQDQNVGLVLKLDVLGQHGVGDNSEVKLQNQLFGRGVVRHPIGLKETL